MTHAKNGNAEHGEGSRFGNGRNSQCVTETDGNVDELPMVSSAYYQLTHDYLVHSLRQWLTQSQRETRRGRAELRLTERTKEWQSQPSSRYLPALWEYANIRLFSRKNEWNAT